MKDEFADFELHRPTGVDEFSEFEAAPGTDEFAEFDGGVVVPKPGFLKRAIAAALAPLPGAQETVDYTVGKARGVLEPAQKQLGLEAPATANPLKAAAVAARNSTIPLPTPETAEAAINLAIPQTPLDLFGELVGGVIGPLAGKLKAARAASAPAAAATEAAESVGLKGAEAATRPPTPDLLGELERVRKIVKSAQQSPTPVRPQSLMTDAEKALYSEFKHPIMQSIEFPQVKLSSIVKAGERAAWESKFATGQQTTPFQLPKAIAQAEPSVDQIAEAGQYVLPDSWVDESPLEFMAEASRNPDFVRRIAAQKRGVVPLASSRKAGQKFSAEDFANLKPGQVLSKNQLDAQAAAARAVQIGAEKELSDVANLFNSGAPMEAVAGRAAYALDAMVKSQGVMSEFGRALGATRLTDSQRTMRKLAMAAFKERLLEEPEKFGAFLRELAGLPKDAIAQRILASKKFISPEDASVLRMFQEFRGAALLSNPITFVRNLTGNTMAVMSNLVERPLAGVIDFATASLTGSPQQRLIGEGTANAYGMWQGLKTGAADALSVLSNEINLKGFGSEFALGSGAIPGRLGRAVRLPFKVLDATDTFFKSVLANGEMHRLAYRTAAFEGLTGAARAKRIEQLMARPTEQMVQDAIKTAREFTFQDKLTGSISDIERAFQRKDQTGAVFKFLVPFFRTPVNVGRFVLERTPLMSELTKRGIIRQAVLNGARSGDVVDAVARNIVGAGAMATASVALYANEGRITGRPPKDKEQLENLYATGWRPYSIKMGDTYISYKGLEPMASWLAQVADLAEDIRVNPDSTHLKRGGVAVESLVKNFVNQPFLTSLKDLLDFMENPMSGRVQAFVASQAASLVPQGAAAVARAKDQTIREPETIIEAMMSRTPFLSERIRAKRTRFGEPIQRTTYFFGLADKPLPATDPIEKELRQLGIPQAVSFPDNRLGNRQLNKDEYNKLLTMAGANIRQHVGALLSQPGYRNLPMEKKVETVKKIVSIFRKDVADQVRPEVELRHLGIKTALKADEMRALNDTIVSTMDYQYMKDKERREVVNDYIKRVLAVRRGAR